MALICYPRDNVDFVASDAGAFFATRVSGVYSADTNLQVAITGARQLTVAYGIAWIRTDGYWGKVIINPDDYNITLPDADGVLDRICRVVIRWDKTANVASLVLRQGDLSDAPVAPTRNETDELYELVLADYLVEHGETAASAARLTDQRLNEDLCGLMRDGVTSIPTSTLYAQATALIIEIEAAYQAVIAGELPAHAFTHVAGGTDAISLRFSDTEVETTDFVADTTYDDYPYRATIPLTNVTASHDVDVRFDEPDAVSGIFAPVAASYDGGIYIYASEVPGTDITIPRIICDQ